MNISAINSFTPMINSKKISNISEKANNSGKEITQLPSINFCAKYYLSNNYVSNIKMFTFDKIAEKSEYSLLRDDMNLNFTPEEKEAYNVDNWMTHMIVSSETYDKCKNVGMYRKNTYFKDGSLLKEEISDDGGKYQALWYENSIKDIFMYSRKIDGKTIESLYPDSQRPSLWHYINTEKDVDVVLDTNAIRHNRGFSNNGSIFDLVTGKIDVGPAYNSSSRALHASFYAKEKY